MPVTAPAWLVRKLVPSSTDRVSESAGCAGRTSADHSDVSVAERASLLGAEATLLATRPPAITAMSDSATTTTGRRGDRYAPLRRARLWLCCPRLCPDSSCRWVIGVLELSVDRPAAAGRPVPCPVAPHEAAGLPLNEATSRDATQVRKGQPHADPLRVGKAAGSHKGPG